MFCFFFFFASASSALFSRLCRLYLTRTTGLYLYWPHLSKFCCLRSCCGDPPADLGEPLLYCPPRGVVASQNVFRAFLWMPWPVPLSILFLQRLHVRSFLGWATPSSIAFCCSFHLQRMVLGTFCFIQSSRVSLLDVALQKVLFLWTKCPWTEVGLPQALHI